MNVDNKKIIIKNTENADSRTATDKITKEILRKDTDTHIKEVGKLMTRISDIINRRGFDHDFTKIKYFDEFSEEVLKDHTNEEFINAHWYQTHIFEERHHLNANCPLDVNLIDVIEMICDCVAAGKGRSGRVTPSYIKLHDPALLERAYWNTVKLLDDITERDDNNGKTNDST